MYYKNPSDTSVAGNVVTTITSGDAQINTFLYGQVALTTDGTAANRRVIVGVYDDSGNAIIDVHSGAVVAASASDQHHELLQGVFRETSFVGGALQVPIPKDLIIPPGYSFKITVENGVAGDSYDYSLAFSVNHVVPGQAIVS